MKQSILIFFLLLGNLVFSQNDEPSKWDFTGYQKFLNSTLILPDDQGLLNDNQLHSRLKLRYYPTENLTFVSEARTRFFWGDQVRFSFLFGQDFLDGINQGSDDYFDWSWGRQSQNGYAFHTTLDRFYGEYSKGNWEIRLGRQRINWGIATTWNPNDIFNAYNFVDFDYEERPGSDAVRVKRYLGFASSIEIAVNAFDSLENATAAVLTKFNQGTYDWQLLAGIVQDNSAIGFGWAGNLGNASFKGEGTWFRSLSGSNENSISFTCGIDYTFQSQLYINGGFLYNSNGTTQNNDDLFSFELSASNLYPYKYAILLQSGIPVSPLLNTGVVIVYSPGAAQATFINPVLTYSIAQNWDLDLIGQLFFQKEETYQPGISAAFLRMKWSF